MSRFLGTCLAFVLVSSALAQSPKVAAELSALRPSSTASVIIQYREAPTEAHHARVAQLGGRGRLDLGVIKAARYTLPARALEQLASDPDVISIQPDRPLSAASTPSTSSSNDNSPDYGWMGVL